MDTRFAPGAGASPGSSSTQPEQSSSQAGHAAVTSGCSAFERLFREQYPVVVRIAFGVTGDAQAAQDVAQDVFVAAFSRFPDPGDDGHAGAWVRVAAAHTALNTIRGERRRARRDERTGIDVAAAGPEEQVLERESRAEVRRALARLPRRAATVLVLRHNGLSYAEVAEAMNVTVGQVGTMLRRAESALRKEFTHASRA
jgi:RNA polymerase sigma factor (sigma-70 family)